MDCKVNYFMNDVAGCGLFQVLTTAAGYFLSITACWSMMFMTFGNYDPGWECVDYRDNSTLTNSNQIFNTAENVTSTLSEGLNNTIHKCLQIVPCRDVMFSQGASTLVTEWSLICDRGWIGSLITSVQMAGVTLGSILAGQIGETFGRKKCMYLMNLFLAITNAIALFSVSWQMYAGIRFFIGVCIGGALSSNQLYPKEFVDSKWRGIVEGIPEWGIGSLMFGICIYLLRDWRQVHIATAVFCGLAMVPLFWTPESLRWLIVHGKKKEAREVALKMLKYNKKTTYNSDVLDFTQCEGRNVDKHGTYVQLFHQSLVKRTMLCSLMFFAYSIMSYGIGFGIGTLSGDFYTNFIIYSILIILAYPFVTVFANTVGRRLGQVISLSFFFVCSVSVIIIIYFVVDKTSQDAAVTFLTLALTAFVVIGWGICQLAVVELFPTSVRSLGFSQCFTAARIGGILAPYLMPRELPSMVIPYFVLAALAIIIIIMALNLPETKGQKLVAVLEVSSTKEETDVNTANETQAFIS